jgi:predicted MFS family arabinose efflux permease
MAETYRFSNYEKFLIATLTLVQFTVVLDFAVMAPLGAQLMRELHIDAKQFGFLVSSYAISAGASGFIIAGYTDRFDRRKILSVVYIGFLIGTLCCALAPDYHSLIAARIVAGLFGGVLSGISYAIVGDTFPYEARGRVMGFIQMAFSGSQILGIPIGLLLAQKFSWHIPFYAIVVLGLMNWMAIYKWMRPVNAHLNQSPTLSLWEVWKNIFSNKKYRMAYVATFFLATGGFLMMPYSSPYMVYNLGLKEENLPIVFFAAGIGSMIAAPFFGRLSDAWGKFNVFLWGSVMAAIMVAAYVHISSGHLAVVAAVFAGMMIMVSSRIISSSAMITAVPDAQHRGSFMNINSALQQISGGVATIAASKILIQNNDNSFANFDTVGYISIISIIVCVVLMKRIHTLIHKS